MNCPKCNSKANKDGKDLKGVQKYKCTNCKYNFRETTADKANGEEKPVSKKIGMTLDEFREKHDVDFIVQKALDRLEKDMIYEKSDIIQLTGLRAGYPGLSATLEAAEFKRYRGRAGGITYWSHPKTIDELREQAKIT